MAFLNSFPVLIFCSFPMHLLFSKICFLVLFMMNHYLQDFLSMNSSMLTNTFSKLAHSIACIISNKRLAYFLVTFFSGFSVHFWIKRKPSNAYSLYCSCGVSNSAMSCKLVLLLGRDYYCKFKEVKANERFKRPKKRNTFCTTGFFGGLCPVCFIHLIDVTSKKEENTSMLLSGERRLIRKCKKGQRDTFLQDEFLGLGLNV